MATIDMDPHGALLSAIFGRDLVLEESRLLWDCQMIEKLVCAAIERFTYREREIIRLRFGFGDGRCYDRETVARIFKINVLRVTQIESEVSQKLRNSYVAELLKLFVPNPQETISV